MFGDEGVDLRPVRADPQRQFGGIGLRLYRQLGQQVADRLFLELGLVEQLEGPFPGTPAATQADQC